MPKKVPNRFETNDDTVYIHREGWLKSAMCTYREDYWNELTSHAWWMNDKNDYPTNKTLGGLHLYMMKKWYGDEAYEAFKKNGYVVDHMNNRHEDCRITNLEFLKKNRNTAKGQEFDIDSNDEKIVRQIALNIFKDFSTGHYQITIGCNVPGVWIDDSGKKFQIESIKLLYTGDYNTYPSIIHDAEGIILAYQTGDRIDPMKTHAACVRIYKALIIRAPQTMPEQPTKHYKEGEKGVRGFMYITSVPYDKGWTVPDNFNGEQQYEIIDQYKNMQVNVNSKNW